MRRGLTKQKCLWKSFELFKFNVRLLQGIGQTAPCSGTHDWGAYLPAFCHWARKWIYNCLAYGQCTAKAMVTFRLQGITAVLLLLNFTTSALSQNLFLHSRCSGWSPEIWPVMCLAVTGRLGSIGECSRLSQPSWLFGALSDSYTR